MSNSDDAADLLAWITLSRVDQGKVTKQGDSYLDGGAPLPPALVVPITTLLTGGSLAVADSDLAGWRQVTVTEAGQARYEQLSTDQGRQALNP